MDLEIWDKGKFISESECFNKSIFFILSGRVKISVINSKNGREQTLFLLSKGDIFDIVSFLDELPRTGIITPLDNIQLLRINSNKLRELIFESRSLSHNLFLYLAKTLRELENLTIDLSLHDVSTRLVRQIIKHVNHEKNDGTLKLIHDFTHDEIAKLIGSSRVVVNRILQTLRKNGDIHLHRGHIKINDTHKLLEKQEEYYKPS